jgi:hypothetical protein
MREGDKAMTHHFRVSAGLLAILVGLTLGARPAGGQAFQGRPFRWNHEFVGVAAACALSDGSVIVTDPGDYAVILLTPTGADRQLGRRGNGPGEYQAPGACFALPGDSALVFDRLMRRFVLLPPGEGRAATLSWPSGLGTGWHEPVGLDEAGAVILRGPRQPGNQEAILRWDRTRGTIDTVTRIDAGAAKAMGTQAASLTRPIPYSPRSGVVAAPGIGVVIVHASPYRVDVWRSGNARRGATLPYTPVPVDQGDIDAYIEANSPPAGAVGMRSDGRPVTIPRRTRTLENFGLTRDDFPEVKPPFDPAGVVPSASGEVWIRLHRPSADYSERYDVVDATGTRREPVTLPPRRRLVAVSPAALVVVATDDDGREFLEVVPKRE